MKNRILIVGGTGFIGFHLSKSLIKSNFIYSISRQNPKKIRKVNGVKYISCDIYKKNNLKKKLKSLKFDYVINLGGNIDHSNKMQTLNSHFFGCKNLVDYFKNKNLKLFIQIGSSLEYGKKKPPHFEFTKCFPNAHYGKSKLRSTKYILKCNKKKPFSFVILRLYQIYGPNQSVNRLIPIIISSCLKNKKFDCSSGKQVRDFLYIDDLIILLHKIINSKTKLKGIFNVGSGKPIQVKKIINLIRKKIKKGFPQFGRIKLRKDEVEKYYPDLKKVTKSINWKAKTSLNSGINKTIAFYK